MPLDHCVSSTIEPTDSDDRIMYLLLKRLTIRANNVHRKQPASHEIVARCEDDGIKLVFISVSHLEACLGKCINRIRLDANNIYVILIENFVVVLLE